MRNPLQPISCGRFKKNAIVEYLLGTHPNASMNSLRRMSFTDDDRRQFAQLIGYSLSGFSELSYVDDQTYSAALAMSEDPALTEDKARILALEAEVARYRQAAEAMREPMATLLGVHPDDLKRRTE